MITMMNAGLVDTYAGGCGPTERIGIQSLSISTFDPNTMPSSFGSQDYQSIFRANILLLTLPNVMMDAGDKARFTAEAKALRATYYFNLVRMFRNIPLLLEPLSTADIYNVTQADPAAVYAQIEKDLTEAIPDLPSSVALST